MLQPSPRLLLRFPGQLPLTPSPQELPADAAAAALQRVHTVSAPTARLGARCTPPPRGTSLFAEMGPLPPGLRNRCVGAFRELVAGESPSRKCPWPVWQSSRLPGKMGSEEGGLRATPEPVGKALPTAVKPPRLLTINASVYKAKVINKMVSKLRGAARALVTAAHTAPEPEPAGSPAAAPTWAQASRSPARRAPASCLPHLLCHADSLCFGVPLPGPDFSGRCGRQRLVAQTQGGWGALSAAGRTVLRRWGRPSGLLAPPRVAIAVVGFAL